ncbi:hypothetical protein F0562_027187 [Nyssa sinensis]|uniref:Homeobox domain-containing protein n=1 Tax=Nyssa sinensis TaxID=561372 RepID=A0A5J5B4B4_9ASTE|nr:hypothetical protein F0562_027187 [Nyssa sinensis]
MQPTSEQLKITTDVLVDYSASVDPQMVSRTPLHILDGEQNLQYQGISLSLATQIQSAVHMPFFQYQHTNQGPSSLLNSHAPNSGEDGCQSKELRNAKYLSCDLSGGTHNAIKLGALNNPQCSISPKDMHSGLHLSEPSCLASTKFNSKYLKAVQQLLDEVINVQRALKQHESDEHHKFRRIGLEGFKETDSNSNSYSMLPLMNGIASNLHESTTNSSCEPSPAEQLDLQNKMKKLLSMLDEADRRYKLCHFRCLRDPINSQIQVIWQSLGEQDATPNGQGGGLPCLCYVDQQLRQQRGLQQLGMMQDSWRPHRGLPESSVSILRAWMFEHFLHPYPKDSEKIMLASQTGLTRSQIANWFINARVRLWKPMVEEMYKEEFGNLEADSKSSPEQVPKAARDKSWSSEDKGEELQRTGEV